MSQRKRRVVISVSNAAAALAATAAPLTFVNIACAACGADGAGAAGSADVARDAARSEYVDGRYTATGWYGSLPSSITVSLSLFDDVVTAVEVTPHATDPTSLDFQGRFAAAVPELVVGRRIDEVKIDRLAGSSGTPQGFNDAVRQIRAQAKQSSRAER